jgi:putative transposase
MKAIGLAQVLTTPRSPWQNPFAERVIGTIRRERGDIVALPQVGGLHHRYIRCAA